MGSVHKRLNGQGKRLDVCGKNRSIAVQYEVMLQEMLSGGGVLHLPAGHRDSRRLACHMALLRELAAAHAFGPLQKIMVSIINEISCCIYTETVCAITVPQILKLCPSEANIIHKTPFFMEIDTMKDELQKMMDTSAKNQDMCEKSQDHQKNLQQKLLSSKAREDQLRADVQVLKKQANILQSELSIVKETSKREQDRLTEQLLSLTSECEKLRHIADRSRLELSFIKGQREEDRSLREAFAALHSTEIGGTTNDSLTRLHNQLLTLLHVRVDVFEANLADSCDSFEKERLREEFIFEAAAMDKEIVALRTHLEDQGIDLDNTSSKKNGASSRKKTSRKGCNDVEDAGMSYLFPDELVEKVESNEAQFTSGLFDGLLNQAEPVWEYFMQRCDHAFRIPSSARVVHKDMLLSTIESVFRAKQDYDDSTQERELMSHFFYSFIHELYGVPNVALLVIHGILVATIQHRKSNSIVAMFHDLLANTLEECAWKYSMYFREMLAQCPITSVHDLQHFAHSLYPGFPSQETGELINEFQNHYPLCTSESLLLYLTSKVMERDEMRLKKWLRALQWRDTQRHGGLGKEEFAGVIQEHFADVPLNRLEHYRNSISSSGKSWAPLDSWAFLCCCLEVLS